MIATRGVVITGDFAGDLKARRGEVAWKDSDAHEAAGSVFCSFRVKS